MLGKIKIRKCATGDFTSGRHERLQSIFLRGEVGKQIPRRKSQAPVDRGHE